MKGYPRWFTIGLVTTILAVLFISGLLLIPTALEMRFEWDTPWMPFRENRLIAAAIHTSFAFLGFILLGALASLHMRHGWKKNKNISSGVAQILVWAGLAASAVGLFYLSSPILILFSSATHVLLGLLLGVLYLWHAFFHGLTRRKSR